MSKALIFDCDGVLADTERDGHLPAFNSMFKAMGLPVEWSSDEYYRLLSISGGKERLSTLFETDLVEKAGLPRDDRDQKELLDKWHKDKTDRYMAMIESGAVPPRPGVSRLANEAARNGWKLAVASTSAERSVRAVVAHVVGAELAERIHVFAGDVVAQKKPAPDIYLLALQQMSVAKADAVVIEDSAIGLRASRAAGLATVVTTSHYTAREDFTGASLAVSSLGQAPNHPARTIADPYQLAVGDQVELGHLERILKVRRKNQKTGEKR